MLYAKSAYTSQNLSKKAMQPYSRFEHLLYSDSARKRVKVTQLNTRGLFELRPRLKIAGIRDQRGTLVAVLECNVPGYGTTLVQNEAIVVEDGNLAKRLLLEVSGRLVLAFGDVDLDKLVRNIFLLENCGDSACTGGYSETDEFENHFGGY